MFTRVFQKGEEQAAAAAAGLKQGADNLAAQGQAAANDVNASGFGQRARNVWAGKGEVAEGAQASASQFAKQAQSLFQTNLPQAGGASGIADQVKLRALKAQEGVKGLYDAIPLLGRERLDIAAMQAAGFGAMGAALQKRKSEAYDMLFVMSSPVRMQTLLALRELVKETAIADPDMPRWCSSRIESMIDSFWGDLTVFSEQMVEEARAKGMGSREHDLLADFGSVPIPMTPWWFRARLLYHYQPFDKSIFGCVKQPLWWLLLVCSLIPYAGIRIIYFSVILVMLLRGCPADEFQLVSFVLSLKGSQFFSSGVVMSLRATVKYYSCVHGDLMHNCDTNGPGAYQDPLTGLVDFVGSCILAWVAFLCLPCSRPSAGTRDFSLDDESDYLSDGGSGSEADGPIRRSFKNSMRCCRRCDANRGGRLFGLIFWDLLSFVTCCFLLVYLCDVDISHSRPGGRPSDGRNWQSLFSLSGGEAAISMDISTWQFRQTFFLIRIFYGLLMVPYVPFQIPLLTGVLTHTTPTGFNLQGMCVPFTLAPMPSKKGH